MSNHKRYRLAITVKASHGPVSEHQPDLLLFSWQGSVEESCHGKGADCRDKRRKMLEAVIETATEQLEEMAHTAAAQADREPAGATG